MKYQTIIEVLSKLIDLKLISSNGTQEIRSVLLIDGTENTFDDHVLYLGYECDISKDTEPPESCILVSENEENDNQISNLSYVLKDDLFLAFNHAKKLLEDQDISYFYDELIDSVCDESSLDVFSNKAAAKLGNPIIILDDEFKVLSHSTIFPIEDALWQNNIEQGYCSYDFVKAVGELESVKYSPKTNEVFEVSCTTSPTRKLCSKILVNDNKVGTVLMLLQDTSVLPKQLKILRSVSLAAGKVLIKYFPYLLHCSIPMQKVLYDLLIGASSEDIAPQIASMKYSSNLVALSIKQLEDEDSKTLTQISLMMANLLPGIQMVFFKKGIAALYQLEDGMQIGCDHRLALVKFAQRHSLKIGVSLPFLKIEDFALYYRQSCQAIELSEKNSDEEYIFNYESCITSDLLYCVNQQVSIASFIHPSIHLLERYDEMNNTKLLETLKMFVEHENSAKETALHLNIHRNSLAYRLKRIAQISSIDFQDGNTIFVLKLSFNIIKLGLK